jgi:hypothetical protein
MDGRRGRFEVLAAIGEVADGALTVGETVQTLLDPRPEFADLYATASGCGAWACASPVPVPVPAPASGTAR